MPEISKPKIKLNSILNKVNKLKNSIPKNINQIVNKGELVEVFEKAFTSTLTEMYKLRDKVDEKKEFYDKKDQDLSKVKKTPQAIIKRNLVKTTSISFKNLSEVKKEILDAAKEHNVGKLIKKEAGAINEIHRTNMKIIDGNFNELGNLVNQFNKIVKIHFKTQLASTLVATKGVSSHILNKVSTPMDPKSVQAAKEIVKNNLPQDKAEQTTWKKGVASGKKSDIKIGRRI